jgi:1-acyl-sn-glycerol-3-phosphate acyltransferase
MKGTFGQLLLRWLRIAHVGLHLAKGALIAALLFPLQSDARRKREIESWSARLCEILRVRIFLHGSPPAYDQRPLMIVANHVSWVDIFAINAVVPVRFVSKAEVRKWPLVGWLSARSGTVFLERARRQDTLRVNEIIASAMRAGDLFAVFPEGTTTDGSTLLKFHSSLLEPAVKAGAAVQPVALRYEREDGSLCTEAAFYGSRSMWDSLIGIVSAPSIVVHVCMLPPIQPGSGGRRALALEAWHAIHRTLYPEAPSSDTEIVDDREAVAQ